MTKQPVIPTADRADAVACIRQALSQARQALDALMNDAATLEAIERARELLCGTFLSGGRVYSCGNGGSMSDAMHFAEELTGRFRGNRAGLPAQAISDVGHLSCVANDFGYDQVFGRYVQSHGRAGDCFWRSAPAAPVPMCWPPRAQPGTSVCA